MSDRFRRAAVVCAFVAVTAAIAFVARGFTSKSRPTANDTLTVLGEPIAEFPIPFTRLDAAREQANGTVITLDAQDRSVSVVDIASGLASPVGRIGSGPHEYLSPSALLPWKNDTILLVDATKYYSLLVITPGGKTAGRLPTTEEGSSLSFRGRIMTDSLGHVFAQIPWYRQDEGRTSPHPDSAFIVRVDIRTRRVDTVMAISTALRLPDVPSSAMDVRTSDRPFLQSSPPFSVRDQWSVTPDGHVVVVSVDPYRVTYVSADGEQRVGGTIATTRIPVGEEHKQRWREQKQRPVNITVFTSAGVSAQSMVQKFNDPPRWPDNLPPFFDKSLQIAPDGKVWIQRYAAAGANPTVDVFDSTGRIERRIQLPFGTRLVGVGRRSLYVARIDQDDLEYLQEYRRP